MGIWGFEAVAVVEKGGGGTATWCVRNLGISRPTYWSNRAKILVKQGHHAGQTNSPRPCLRLSRQHTAGRGGGNRRSAGRVRVVC